MKQTKKKGKRLLASILSAALLTSSAAASLTQTPAVKAAGDNDYYEALALSLYMYDANACGSDVDSNPLTWRGNCHTYDGKAAISAAVNFDSSTTSLVDPDGDGYVDVDGGYHDAGDHIKFNLTMGFAMSSLAMSEYLNPGVYEKAGCKDHLIAVLKRNADYLMKTTFLDASGNVATICHVVADGNVDHSEWTPPEQQTYPRATYWLTANSNNSAVCGEMAAALAGTAYVVKDSDPAYAAECIKYAKALVAFGKQHVGNETCGLGGFYDTEAQYEDEMAVAEAWLYVCGEGAKPTLTPTGTGNYGSAGYDGFMYCWNKVFQGYAAMMYKATGDSTFSSELEKELQSQGGLSTSSYNATSQTWGAARYNCALQMDALAVANGDANSSYAQAAKYQMDYILGNNPTGYSFLLGYGDKWPVHIHHRAANPGQIDNNPEMTYTLYGALVGGPDGSGNYTDRTDAYQFTEMALDYNGCFALACAGIANLYGGSDKGAANILSGASEVTYPFDFGSGTVTPPTPTTPTEQPSSEENPTDQPSSEDTSQDTTGNQNPETQAPTNPPQSSTGDASYTEKKNEEGQTYWTFDTTNAVKLTVTMKSNSNDTESNGAFNPPGGWAPLDWEASVNGGTFVVEYNIPSGQSSVDFYVWWPTSATLESAVLTYETTVTPSEPTTDPTETPQQPSTETPSNPETTPTEQNPNVTPSDGNVSVYGDMDGDGELSIVDVIILNRYLLLGEPLSDQAQANADVDRNGSVNATDSLNMLKAVVKLITLPV